MINPMSLRLRSQRAYPIVHEPAKIGLVSQQVPTAFGSVHIVCEKERSSPEVVLFLHGLGGSWVTWSGVIAAVRDKKLLHGKDVLLVDLPSFGKSENQLGHLMSVNLELELRRIVQQLGYASVHIVGHSMGGFLALDMAARMPMVTSVHVVAGSYFTLLKVTRNPRAHVRQSPAVVAFYGLQMFLSERPRAAKALNSVSKATGSLFELGGKAFVYASDNARDYDPHGMWGSITVPVCAVFGAKDKLVPPQDMYELHKVLPHARLHVIPGVGHTLLIDKPGEVAEALFSDIGN